MQINLNSNENMANKIPRAMAPQEPRSSLKVFVEN
jgi:hypothetical protein